MGETRRGRTTEDKDEVLMSQEESTPPTHRQRSSSLQKDTNDVAASMAKAVTEAREVAMQLENSELLAEVLNHLGIAEAKMNELVEQLKASEIYEQEDTPE